MNQRTAAVLAVLTASTATVGGTYMDTHRPEPRYNVTVDAGAGQCVIPDCRTLLGRGTWDWQHEEVDCRFGGPFARGGSPVWRGCSVGPREYAVGAQCLPARCVLLAGEDPLREAP